MTDILTELRRAVDTGKTDFGSKSALMHAKKGDTKAIVYAQNTPIAVKEKLIHYSELSKIKTVQVEKTSKELGEVCGKPFTVSAVSIQDAGHSSVLDVLKGKKVETVKTKVRGKSARKQAQKQVAE